MGDLRSISMLESNSLVDFNALQLEEEEFLNGLQRRAVSSSSTIGPPNLHHHLDADNMLSSEYLDNFLDLVTNTHTESSDIQKTAVFEIKTNGATLVMNASLNATESVLLPDPFYRHSMAMTVVYCVAYLLVFAVGLVGNFFVIAVVFRSPRMRTVTNFFIVNLAVADILVIIFCLPATLMINIYVRKYDQYSILAKKFTQTI